MHASILLIALIACGPKTSPEVAADPTPEAPELPSADDLFEAAIAAIGGAEAYADYENSVTTGTLEMAAQGLTMEMEIRHVEPSQLRTRMDMPGIGVIESGFDGEYAWEINPMTGPRLPEGAELEQARRQADYQAAMNYVEFYPTRETVDRVDFNGADCWKVAVTNPLGNQESIYFAVEGGLQAGMDSVIESDMGQMPVTTVMSDWQEFEGLLMATRLSQSMGPLTMETTITGMELNVDPAPDVSVPEEIQALLDAREGTGEDTGEDTGP